MDRFPTRLHPGSPLGGIGFRPPHHGWSLVELSAVVVIIGIGLALLLPALGQSREAARQVQCLSHLRNLALATQQYATARQQFPPAASHRWGTSDDHGSDPARHSLISRLLPYMEQATRYQQLDLRQDWNAPVNAPHTRQHLGGILLCPSAPHNRRRYHVSDYCPAVRIDASDESGLGALLRSGRLRNRSSEPGPNWGNHRSVWDNVLQLDWVDYIRRRQDRRIVRPRDVRDGLSHTLLIVENAGKPICYRYGVPANCTITRFRWASPNLWMTINDFCGQSQLVNCSNNSQPYSFHPGGLNLALADGSACFRSQDLDPNLFVSLVTMAAGD